jgi:hypothetical protein
MTIVGQPERVTQDRVVALFRDELGYRYLGDRTDRDDIHDPIYGGLLLIWRAVLSRRNPCVTFESRLAESIRVSG